MLDQFTRYTPAISLLAIAGLSIFNIGYFWRIGLHYIGLVDLSNLVYSFGLMTVILGLVGIFIPPIVRWFSESKPDYQRYLRSTYIILLLAGAIGMFAEFAPRRYVPTHTVEDGLMLLSGLIGIFGLSSLSWLRIKILGSENSSALSFTGLIAIFCVFMAGLFVADLETASIETFVVETKNETFNSARIIRTSSSGFLLFVDRKGIFVPQSEVKSVKANLSPDDRH